MTDADRERLRRLLLERSVRRGDFVLASGQRSSYYIDCRLTTMSAEGLVLIGRLGLRGHPRPGLDAHGAVGGLTMGADPVAYAIAAASWGSEPRDRRVQRAQGGEGRTAPGGRSKGTSRRGCGRGDRGRDHLGRVGAAGDRCGRGGQGKCARRPGGGGPGRRRARDARVEGQGSSSTHNFPRPRHRSTLRRNQMDFDSQVKVSVYRHFADTGEAPSTVDIAGRLGCTSAEVVDAFTRLRLQRVLLLEEDGATIRMAPPFSGVPTPHRVESAGRWYFANCAWDALGIPAALAPERSGLFRVRPVGRAASDSRSDARARARAHGSSTAWCPPRAGGWTWSSPEARCSSSGRKNGSAMVPRAGDCAAPARDRGAALAARHRLVQHPSGRDARRPGPDEIRDLCGDRAGGPVLGSTGGHLQRPGLAQPGDGLCGAWATSKVGAGKALEGGEAAHRFLTAAASRTSDARTDRR